MNNVLFDKHQAYADQTRKSGTITVLDTSPLLAPHPIFEIIHAL
jgi:hypothetical protein